MASSSSSSGLVAVAVLATLVAGARCAALKVTFTVEKGSDEKHLAVLVKYEGDSMAEVELREHGSNEWVAMVKTDGDVWRFESEEPLQGPFNFRFLTVKGMKNVFDDVIPAKYTVGATYAPEQY
ncbi:hypothetical protein ACQ4PT_003446 [Festuca glaucescens]